MINNLRKINTIKYKGFWLTSLYLYFLVDYFRPQSVLPVFGYIRPGLLVILIVMVIILMNNSHVNWRSKNIKLSLYFLFLMAILTLFAHNGFLAYTQTLSIFLKIPIMISIILLIDSRLALRKLFWLQGLISLWLFGYALLHGGRGPGSFLADENDLALYATTWLPLFIYLFISAESKFGRLTAILFIGGAISTVVVSASRGGFVGLLSVGLIYWLYSPYKFKIAMAFIIITGVGFLLIDPSYWQDMQTITDTEEGTADQRIDSWKAGWNMFIHNPWGVGPGNFNVLFGLYQPETMSRNMYGRAAHSLWFTLLPEMGVIGTVLYLRLILTAVSSCLWLNKQSENKENKDLDLSICCISSLVGFFSCSTFLSSLYYPHFWYLIVIIYCAKKIHTHDSSSAELTQAQSI